MLARPAITHNPLDVRLKEMIRLAKGLERVPVHREPLSHDLFAADCVLVFPSARRRRWTNPILERAEVAHA